MESVNKVSLGSNEREKALGYLLFLDPVAAADTAEQWKMNCPPPIVIDTADDCIMCLSCFMSEGIWSGYLFSHPNVWGIYIKSLADERFHKALELVMSAGGPGDLILYLRACYKFGYQVIPDQEYDALEQIYLGAYPNLSYLNDYTNDDLSILTPIVKDAVKLSGFRSSKEAAPRKAEVTGSFASLNSEKSTSVRPVRSCAEAYQYLLDNADKAPATHWSLKVDGFNTKCLFHADGTGLDVAISRGRASDGWDYTEAIRRVVDLNCKDVSLLSGKITGEAIVDSEALAMLRMKYPGKDYKTPKSTAGAMLRSPQSFDVDDYQYLHFYPFDVEGYSKDAAFELLERAGLQPPPSFRFEFKQIPLDSLEIFSRWLESTIMDPLWEYGKAHHIGSDGVVLQLLSDVENDRADKYSDLNIALKFSHWTEAEYTSHVVDILFEQRRVEMSVVLKIDPVTTRDLNVATRVSVGSPAILVKDNVRVGDEIVFARKSEAMNIYLGKR